MEGEIGEGPAKDHPSWPRPIWAPPPSPKLQIRGIQLLLIQRVGRSWCPVAGGRRASLLAVS